MVGGGWKKEKKKKKTGETPALCKNWLFPYPRSSEYIFFIMNKQWCCGECSNKIFHDFDSYMEHKTFHSLRCTTCKSSFKSVNGMKSHMKSVAHKMAVELEDKYLATVDDMGVTSPEIDMHIPEDGSSTNIVYTTKTSYDSKPDGFFTSRKGL